MSSNSNVRLNNTIAGLMKQAQGEREPAFNNAPASVNSTNNSYYGQPASVNSTNNNSYYGQPASVNSTNNNSYYGHQTQNYTPYAYPSAPAYFAEKDLRGKIVDQVNQTGINAVTALAVADHAKTPGGKQIRTVVTLPSLNFTMVSGNQDDKVDGSKHISERRYYPIIATKSPKVGSLSRELPLQLAETLGQQFNTEITTAKMWLQKQFCNVDTSRLQDDLLEYSFVSPMPVAGKTNSSELAAANFVPVVQIAGHWIFLSYNSAGSVSGAFAFNGGEGDFFPVLNGKHGDQKEWSAFPIYQSALDAVEQADPKVAQEMRKNTLTIVAIRVQAVMPEPTTFIKRTTVEKSVTTETEVYRSCPSSNLKATKSVSEGAFGLVGEGQKNYSKFVPSQQKALYYIATGAFVINGAILPIDVTQQDYDALDQFLDATLRRCDTVLEHVIREPRKLLSKEAAGKAILEKLELHHVIERTEKVSVFFESNTGRWCVDLTNSKMSSEGGQLLFNSKPIYCDNMPLFGSYTPRQEEGFLVVTYAFEDGKPVFSKRKIFNFVLDQFCEVYLVEVSSRHGKTTHYVENEVMMNYSRALSEVSMLYKITQPEFMGNPV